MAKPVKAVAAKKDAAVTDAPKNSKKKLIIIILIVLLAGGGGAAWYFLIHKNSNPSTEEHKVVIPKDPIFIPLDVFTVNLQREDADQYLQTSLSFKVFDPELPEKINAVLPEIRSKLNLLLSSKYPSELSTIAGKKKLAAEIVVASNKILGIHNTPKKHANSPDSLPAPVSEVDATNAHSDGEAATDVTDKEATNPEDTVEPAPKQHKGIVDVMFTSFIIQ